MIPRLTPSSIIVRLFPPFNFFQRIKLLKQGSAHNTSSLTLLAETTTILKNSEAVRSARHHPPSQHPLPSGRLHAQPAILISANWPRSHPRWASCTVYSCIMWGCEILCPCAVCVSKCCLTSLQSSCVYLSKNLAEMNSWSTQGYERNGP